MTRLAITLAWAAVCGALVGACAAAGGSDSSAGVGGAGNAGSTGGAPNDGGANTATSIGSGVVIPDAGPCTKMCSSDFHSIVDCHGTVLEQCSGADGCDNTTDTCANACQTVVSNKQSVGCEYYATDMDQFEPDLCFAAFVANTWDTPVHIDVDFVGAPLPIVSFARIPNGAGPSLTYAPYDPVAGLGPGEVVILFLAGKQDGVNAPCPIPPAMATEDAQILETSGKGHSFHITTDVPVVMYQINPYGGGTAAVTGASLLLPTSAWDTNYVAVTATPADANVPSMNIIAAEDDTTITMLPSVLVEGGGALLPGPVNVPYVFTLDKGEMAQFTQHDDLTGSVIQSDKPIGFMAGQPCMRAPIGVAYCDHGEQMIPPIRALGSEYVGVMFRPRVTVNGAHDQAIWHVVGVVDGTILGYSSSVGGPATLHAGQVIDFITDQPFVVKSQDATHPFMLFAYMSGSTWALLNPNVTPPTPTGYGDADFVINVPPQQYLSDYVFFADPTYPETNLVVVRAKNAAAAFDDVTLDCAGVLTGWQPVGDYEWTRIDLIRHDFVGQNGCSTGPHAIKSKSPFGLWVWGWGSPETKTLTQNVSYGYPGGMNVQPINHVIVPPMPK